MRSKLSRCWPTHHNTPAGHAGHHILTLADHTHAPPSKPSAPPPHPQPSPTMRGRHGSSSTHDNRISVCRDSCRPQHHVAATPPSAHGHLTRTLTTQPPLPRHHATSSPAWCSCRPPPCTRTAASHLAHMRPLQTAASASKPWDDATQGPKSNNSPHCHRRSCHTGFQRASSDGGVTRGGGDRVAALGFWGTPMSPREKTRGRFFYESISSSLV